MEDDEGVAAKAAAEKKEADAAVEAAASEETGGSDTAVLTEAEKVLKEIKEQNKILEDNLKKITKVSAEIAASGRAPAGTPEKTKEEKEIEMSRELLKGTGFESLLFPTAEEKAAGKK